LTPGQNPYPSGRLPVAAGIMAMALGDAGAAIVGRRWGRHRYRVPGGATKSWEGSAAFVVLAFAGIVLAGLAAGSADPDRLGALVDGAARLNVLGTALTAGLAAALVSAVAEAVTPWGLDNLTVPLSAASVMAFWPA
jgi:phytol kinase